jgi:hypothetical protein
MVCSSSCYPDGSIPLLAPSNARVGGRHISRATRRRPGSNETAAAQVSRVSSSPRHPHGFRTDMARGKRRCDILRAAAPREPCAPPGSLTPESQWRTPCPCTTSIAPIAGTASRSSPATRPRRLGFPAHAARGAASASSSQCSPPAGADQAPAMVVTPTMATTAAIVGAARAAAPAAAAAISSQSVARESMTTLDSEGVRR